jgi:hypothetical protein
MAIPMPSAFPAAFRVDTDVMRTKITSINKDSSRLCKVQHARAALAAAMDERSGSDGALKAYREQWLSFMVPALTEGSVRSSVPLCFAWSGPFGHNYIQVPQTCILFESAMLGVAVAVHALHRGRALACDGKFKEAAARFEEASDEFGGVGDTMAQWSDADAVALCAPVLRRDMPRSMQLHAAAWMHLAWGMQSYTMNSKDIESLTVRILTGAVERAREAAVLMRGVHVGTWRPYANVFLCELEIVRDIILARKFQMHAKNEPNSFGIALRIVHDSVAGCNLHADNAVRAFLHAQRDKLEHSNRTIYYQLPSDSEGKEHVPEPVFIK